MASIPKKVAERIVAGLKRYQPILTAAKARDVGETDTVTIVKDMMADIFGYDKYSELTSEYAIRSTYCDLAIKLDGKLSTLIEVKAIGIDLKEAHVKQAVDYAANQGVDWVLLTNGIRWCVYRVFFTRPIGQYTARGVRHGLLTLFLLEVKKRKEESREGVWREERPRSDSSRIGSVWNFGERPQDGGQERLAQRNSGGDGSKRNDDDTQLDQWKVGNGGSIELLSNYTPDTRGNERSEGVA